MNYLRVENSLVIVFVYFSYFMMLILNQKQVQKHSLIFMPIFLHLKEGFFKEPFCLLQNGLKSQSLIHLQKSVN